MSAERLREAAARLREVAEAATPGPWEAGDEPIRYAAYEGCVRSLGMTEGFSDEIGQLVDYPDSAYIALMAPPVALEMAAVLDNLAEANERGHLIGTFGAAGLLDTILGPTS